jgi:hypothetical protein
VYEGGIKL